MLLYFYRKTNGRSLVRDYFECLSQRAQAKAVSFVKLLAESGGKLGMPYARHINGKIWKLRVDYGDLYHRIFYLILERNEVIFLHGYDKKTNKAPTKEINLAINNYNDFINNPNFEKYEC